jgi:hypothetical protein
MARRRSGGRSSGGCSAGNITLISTANIVAIGLWKGKKQPQQFRIGSVSQTVGLVTTMVAWVLFIVKNYLQRFIFVVEVLRCARLLYYFILSPYPSWTVFCRSCGMVIRRRFSGDIFGDPLRHSLFLGIPLSFAFLERLS